jgi:Kef-type K+ transport system membrane component KefB
VLGLIEDPEQLTSVTDIGIALLLFIVGLELQPSRLWRLRKDIFGLGLAQVAQCGIAISLFIHISLQV